MSEATIKNMRKELDAIDFEMIDKLYAIIKVCQSEIEVVREGRLPNAPVEETTELVLAIGKSLGVIQAIKNVRETT